MPRMTLAVAAVVVMASAAVAEAQSARSGGVATGCSNFGKGCISGPTRQGRFGREVRMPGGTWIGCKGSCGDTLRDETIDFWMKRDIERGDRGGGLRRP
jgi:hypothetical protein